MSININLSFSGGVGVFVLGLLVSAAASYSESYFQTTASYGNTFFLGIIAMIVGLSLTLYTLWLHWYDKYG